MSTSTSADAGCPKVVAKKEGDFTGVIQRTRTLNEVVLGEARLLEFDCIDCDGAPIVDAFPSTGVVSVLAGMQLVKSMALPLVGVIKSSGIPAVATVQCEQPSHPARVYGNRSIVIFVCEMNLEDEVARSIAALIFDFARRHKCPMIYTVEGMATGDTIKLDSGEEVSLAQSDEEGGGEEGMHTFIDDSKLAEAHMKKQEEEEQEEQAKKANESPKPAEDNAKAAKGDKELAKKAKNGGKKGKGDDAKASGKSKKQHGKKKGGAHDDDAEAEEDQAADGEAKKSKESLARKLYGNKVHFLTTDVALAQKLRGLDCIPVVDGVISGVTGAVLAEAALTEQAVTGLVVPTSTIIPSAKSAIVLLQLLEKLIPSISISVSELEKLEDELEEVRKAVMKALPALAGPKANPPSNLYL